MKALLQFERTIRSSVLTPDPGKGSAILDAVRRVAQAMRGSGMKYT
jgi:hypothetical protein